jgi:hypothetical protein
MFYSNRFPKDHVRGKLFCIVSECLAPFRRVYAVESDLDLCFFSKDRVVSPSEMPITLAVKVSWVATGAGKMSTVQNGQNDYGALQSHTSSYHKRVLGEGSSGVAQY